MKHQFFQGDRDAAVARGMFSSGELEIDEIGKFSVSQVVTIGRAPDCDVVVNTRSISRKHARIFFEGGHFWIKDLDSANGTSVNGKKVKLQILVDGDKICFGEARAVFRASPGPPGPVPLAADPMAGLDGLFQDGTPTGGIRPPAPCLTETPEAQKIREMESTIEKLRQEAAAREEQISQLSWKADSLRCENETLRKEFLQHRGTQAGFATLPASKIPLEALEAENEKLRRLVSQLERALADTSIRLRNLQERLDQPK